MRCVAVVIVAVIVAVVFGVSTSTKTRVQRSSDELDMLLLQEAEDATTTLLLHGTPPSLCTCHF